MVTVPLDHYAVVEDNTIVNVVVSDDPAYAAEQGWTDVENVPGKPWIGWTYDGANWNPPPDPVP